MAAAAEEGMSAAALVMSVPDSIGRSPESEGVGAGDEEKDAATKGTVAVGDSEEDGEDVFEVERILDMKCEGGKNLYKVRWKGYTSEDDTWEPEVHLEDCKEVLLEFRKKLAENKAKAVRKDIQRLSLNNDIFEADSDSDQQSDTKEDISPRKKKKKIKCKEETSPEDLRKKRTKMGKLKDKFKTELESTSEIIGFDVKTKKRIWEVKEELKDSKKPKKDEIKETKELKKANKRAEVRDLKIKIREDVKENRKTKKERYIESPLESESPNDSLILEDDSEDFISDNREENQNVRSVRDKTAQETVQEGIFEKHLDDLISIEEDDLLRLLITKGAKVNGRQKNGTTALIHAAEKNFLTTVAILLEAGAFVNVQQSNGETALMKACKRGNSDIVRLVIECGADCNILSKHQNSALYFAKQCNNVLVYELLHKQTLLDLEVSI